MVTAEELLVLKEQADKLQTRFDSMSETITASLPSVENRKNTHRITGLRLKGDTELFTAEEKSFFAEIKSVLDVSMQYVAETSDTIKLIQREKVTEKAYAGEPIRLPGLTLEEIDEENKALQIESQRLFDQLHEMYSLSTAIGWSRYIRGLAGDYDRIMTEAKEIAESIDLVNFYEAGHTKVSFPKALRISIDTPYYDGGGFRIMPEEEDISKAFEVFEVYLYQHRKALELSGFSTEELDSLIEQRKQVLLSAPMETIEEAELEQIVSPFPETYYFPKDKISNKLTSMVSGRDHENKVQLASKDEKKKGLDIIGKVIIDFDDMGKETSINGLTISANNRAITPYEKLVINAVFTVWENARISNEINDGEATTTLHNLYRIIAQNRKSDPTKEAMDKLRKALMKLATGYMDINVSEEAKHHKNMGNFVGREGAFMQIVIDRLKVNGQMSDVVHITRLDNTPLYAYASITNRIANIPMKQLDTKSRNKNEETMIINDYLLSRIEAIPHISNKIVIDTMLSECEIKKEDFKNWKNKRAKTVKKALDLLDGYADKNLIKSYRIMQRGKVKYHSIIINK